MQTLQAGSEEKAEAPPTSHRMLAGNVYTTIHWDQLPEGQEGSMPVIQIETAVAAGAVNNNLVAGSAFEFARTRSLVSIGLTQSATGGFATIQSGADVIAEEFSPVILTRFPVIPDEMYYTDLMEAGDRLVLRYRNPTAGSLTVRALVQMSGV